MVSISTVDNGCDNTGRDTHWHGTTASDNSHQRSCFGDVMTLKHFTHRIKQCGNRWWQAFELLLMMRHQRSAPDVIIFNALISACGKGKHLQGALQLLEKMQLQRIVPDVITYNASISACEKGNHWQEALRLLGQMQLQRIVPNVITYNALASAILECGPPRLRFYSF